MNSHAFDELIVGLYVVLSIYLMTINRPYVATLMFSLALSIKTGAIVLVPGLLCWTYWLHGIKKFGFVVFIIVVVEMVVAAPFVFEPGARMLGF